MKSIAIVGDNCLDVVGVPILPPSRASQVTENWRQTGETRTHYLPGGALLLESWVRSATPRWNVAGNTPCRPAALSAAEGDEPLLDLDEFLALAERLSRNEIIHSLLAADRFAATNASKDQRLRVRATHGFSGPESAEPSLRILPPSISESTQICVIDDTGNRFRCAPELWPSLLTEDRSTRDVLAVYKLHRPFPVPSRCEPSQPDGSRDAALWSRVEECFGPLRIVVISVDDLREMDVPISRGLSWERTALDLVWQLLNVPALAELRGCPHLIVRFGLDGALYWRTEEGGSAHRAWLIYDPSGIEGTGVSRYAGTMVGYGSAFIAAFVGHLAKTCDVESATAVELLQFAAEGERLPAWIEEAVIAALRASRRLLAMGYGPAHAAPRYPGAELFNDDSRAEGEFACERVPIIPEANVPDRGYWRLLDSIFHGKRELLHMAVELTASGAQPNTDRQREAMRLVNRVPLGVFAKVLRTYDRLEIENYRALYQLMQDYVSQLTPPRPLSVAVFGPPGAGKSFGVKAVAKALEELGGPRPIETRTFNLSQYQAPEQLADVFHLVRDLALRGRIPLVFFDEFDTTLAGDPLGWLRYFLAPMQDGEFLDNGTPHPIGQAIFVFAGGTCSTYAEFAKPYLDPVEKKDADAFKLAKGPDFLSRLRGTLDVPGLDLDVPFDAYGPVEAFPCEAAILLRRAGILSHLLGQKAPRLRDSAGALHISPYVSRALLHLPEFQHGNRSFEAILDMSRLSTAERLNPSLLPSASHVALHANPAHLSQLLATHYPFPPDERDRIAKSIHESYRDERRRRAEAEGRTVDESLPEMQDWGSLREDLKESNRAQADHIAVKLRKAGLWCRKRLSRTSTGETEDPRLQELLEGLAQAEHDRWVAEKRAQGWIAAPDMDRASRDNRRLLHNSLFPWDDLTEELKELDRSAVREIPRYLEAADYEIYRP